MENQKEFLEEIKRVVLSFDNRAEVILYGSRARGDFRKDSDWDVLILTSVELDATAENAVRDRIYGIELKYTQPVSSIIVEKQQWQKLSITGFYENVINDGVAL